MENRDACDAYKQTSSNDFEVTVPISIYDDEGNKKSQSTLLIEIGQRNPLLRDHNGDAYTEIKANEITKTMKIRSREFREHLSYEIFKLTGKGCNSNALGDAITTLEAKAKFTGESVTIAVRSHHADDAVFIDMGCDKRRILQVHKGGWMFTEKSPVKFVRKNGMTALPTPKRGHIDDLMNYLNVDKEEFPLIYGWLFCALAGVKPFPIMVLQGEQGTGKSTASRVLRSLVDPSSVPLRAPPREVRDLLVSAANNHVVTLDNLSGINAEVSDALCRLSTGGGHDARKLHTDDEQHLIELQKPVLVNGIDDIATRPDLAERSFIINLQPIESSSRYSEKEFFTRFEKARPALFGALLDGIASGLKNYGEVILLQRPRMADVAHWVAACELDIGKEGQFIEAHVRNQKQAVELGIDASPIGTTLIKFMADKDKWHGSPSSLFDSLTELAGERVSRSKSWPLSTKGMNNSIKRLKPNLRKMGYEIDEGRNRTGRYIEIIKTATDANK